MILWSFSAANPGNDFTGFQIFSLWRKLSNYKTEIEPIWGQWIFMQNSTGKGLILAPVCGMIDWLGLIDKRAKAELAECF